MVGQLCVARIRSPTARCHQVSPSTKILLPGPPFCQEVAVNAPAASKTPRRTGKESALRKAGWSLALAVEFDVVGGLISIV
ncbi:MAG: hypothetical protein DMG27_20060 [Acidobacteria bacterium]|nr:MAG: hypothetical protein DMG27_20060 [Acidobacteriota bacterium]